MTVNRAGASACILDSKFVFVVGGSGGHCTYLNKIEKYIIDQNFWIDIVIKSEQQLSNRFNTLTYKIDSKSIIIAGGEDD